MTPTPPVCDYEGSDYQRSIWDKGGRKYEDLTEAIALKHMLPNRGQWMLELGAGAGRNTLRYSGFKHVVLLDYSISQLEQARQRLGRADRYLFVAGDIYRLPFRERSFDAATMIRALHHMADARKALEQQEMRMPAARPGGGAAGGHRGEVLVAQERAGLRIGIDQRIPSRAVDARRVVDDLRAIIVRHRDQSSR